MESDTFFNELQGESDRACALIAASALSDILQRLLTAKFIEMTESEHDQLFDQQNAVLSSFSSRIRMAHALGLLSKKERKNLDTIRDIRNTFAHAVANITFDTDEVEKACKKLVHVKDDSFPPGCNNKQLFIISSMAQYLELFNYTSTAELSKLRAKVLLSYVSEPGA
jgi:uncharacterized protein YPO0396